MRFRNLLVLGFLILVSTVMWLGASEVTDSYSKAFQVEGRPSLMIKNVDGRTRLLAKEGSTVEVKVTKEVQGAKNVTEAKKAADRVEVRLEQIGNRIEIAAKYPKGFSDFIVIGSRPSVLVHFEITAPPSSDITASMVDGEFEVRGFNGKIGLSGVDGDTTASELSGEIKISAVDGDINATHLSGKSEISMTDGNIVSEECTGQLTVRSADGKTQVKDFQGMLEAKSGDGDLFLEGVFQTLNSRTVDGDVDIHVRSGSTVQNTWTIHNGDGNLNLYLPNPFPADVRIKTSDGKIATNFPIEISGRISERNVSGKMNGGGNIFTIETTDGNISISQTPQ